MSILAMGEWRPCLAGAIAGSCMALVDQPFDTTKVRMQASPSRYAGVLDCVRRTVVSEGVLALYKGVVPALLANSATAALRFGLQHSFVSVRCLKPRYPLPCLMNFCAYHSLVSKLV